MDAEAKVFSILLIFLGVGIVGYGFSTLIVLFVDGKIRDLWKGSQMNRRIAKSENHYIVCGSGELSDVVCQKFKKEQLDFVVITENRKI